MKLSISNIAWSKENDEEMYEYLSNLGFDGIEIAPTRIIEVNPYEHIDEAKEFANNLRQKYNLEISSMQSIWFGKQERIFKNVTERNNLLEYTKKAIDFANAINCKNLVFGCPRNRIIENKQKDYEIAIEFFSEIGNYAMKNGICLSIEPNPTIYNTNFITTTEEAIQIKKDINNPAIKINLDIGTIIQNKENIDILKGNEKLINHIHISEPNLEIIQERQLHEDLINLFKKSGYNGYFSIEMKKQNDIQIVKNVINYVNNVFNRRK